MYFRTDLVGTLSQERQLDRAGGGRLRRHPAAGILGDPEPDLVAVGIGGACRPHRRRRGRTPRWAALESAPDTWWLSDDSGDAGGGARSCRRWKSLGPRHHSFRELCGSQCYFLQDHIRSP